MDNENFREETDSMGSVMVPADALYGAQTQRAVDNFTISGQPMRWSFIETVLLIKLAACRANAELELLSGDMAKRIEEAINTVLARKPLHQFPVPVLQTGSGTSTNMNVNEVVASLANIKPGAAPVSPNDHVNLGQSSNDVIPAAIHVAASRAAVDLLLPALSGLARAIRQVGEAHGDVVKTGRTHLMDALPIRFQEELEAWAVQLDEARERIQSSMLRLARLPLGGTAIGSGVNCHPDFAGRALLHLNSLTGLTFTQAPSKYKNISSLDTAVEFSGQLKTCAISLSKIANDLRWMNSGPLAGLAEIRLPALQPGSSIMPAKVNPVIPEAVCMACAQVIGNDTTVALGGLGGSFQLNTMLPVVADKILESVELLSGSCRSLEIKAISGMTINRPSLEQPLSRNPILATALNPLVGYLKAAEIGKRAMRENRTVLEVALERTDIPRERLEEILDPMGLAGGNSGDRG